MKPEKLNEMRLDLAKRRKNLFPQVVDNTGTYFKWYDSTITEAFTLLESGENIENTIDIARYKNEPDLTNITSFNLLSDSEKTQLNTVTSAIQEIKASYRNIRQLK